MAFRRIGHRRRCQRGSRVAGRDSGQGLLERRLEAQPRIGRQQFRNKAFGSRAPVRQCLGRHHADIDRGTQLA